MLCVADAQSTLMNSNVARRQCLTENTGAAFGRYSEAPVRVRVDSWVTSRLTAYVALILLRERMGFTNVELVTSRRATKFVYEEVASGAQHLAFEVWPSTDKAPGFREFAKGFRNTSASVFVQPSLMVTKQGWYRTRGPPRGLLDETLQTDEGVAHFAETAIASGAAPCTNATEYPCDADDIWRPAMCHTSNCTQLLHPDRRFMSGVHEAYVTAARLPLAVAYAGYDRLKDLVWDAAKAGRGVLFYWWSPTEDFYDVPLSDFEPVAISRAAPAAAERVAFVNARMQKLESRTLHALDRGEDAAQLLRAFQTTPEDYAALAQYYSAANDNAYWAACTWVTVNEERWSQWLSFPSRASTPLHECHMIWDCHLCYVVIGVETLLSLLILSALCLRGAGGRRAASLHKRAATQVAQAIEKAERATIFEKQTDTPAVASGTTPSTPAPASVADSTPLPPQVSGGVDGGGGGGRAGGFEGAP